MLGIRALPCPFQRFATATGAPHAEPMTETEPQPTLPPPAPPPGTPAPDLLRAEAAPLAGLLSRLRARAGRLVLARGVLLAAAAAAGLLILAALLLALKQEWARTAGWSLAGLVLIAGFV